MPASGRMVVPCFPPAVFRPSSWPSTACPGMLVRTAAGSSVGKILRIISPLTFARKQSLTKYLSSVFMIGKSIGRCCSSQPAISSRFVPCQFANWTLIHKNPGASGYSSNMSHFFSRCSALVTAASYPLGSFFNIRQIVRFVGTYAAAVGSVRSQESALIANIVA